MRSPVRAVLQVGLATMVLLGLGVLPAQTLATNSPPRSPAAGAAVAPLLTAPATEGPRRAPSLERPNPARPVDRGPDKLDGPLGQLALAYGSGGLIQAQQAADTAGVPVREDAVQVIVAAPDGSEGAALAGAVRALGGQPQGADGELLQALVPLRALSGLAAHPDVRHVRLPLLPVAQDIVTEARAALGPGPWDQLNIRGKGAKVGIVDLGFANTDALLRKELPGQITARSFRDDQDLSGAGIDHGAAVAEVIHDLAPDASLYLANFTTEVEFSGAVNWMLDQGVQIINVSVGWPATGAGDGSGTINNVVRRAHDRGAVWVQAAGNFGTTHWSGPFTDRDGNNFNNFTTTDEGNTIVLPVGAGERIYKVDVTLTWDDWTCWCQDYDLYLLRGDAVVAQSTAWQNGNLPPVERISYTTPSPGPYWLAIQRFRTTRRVNFDMYATADYNMEYRTAAGSLAIPGDSRFAITVGAINFEKNELRGYSSQGPTKDGRPKPDLVAPDGVSTATLGPRAFEGTSASAPHVAGALALFKSQRPSLTAGQLESLLLSRTVGGTGTPHPAFGWGRLHLGLPLPGVFLPIVTRGVQMPQ